MAIETGAIQAMVYVFIGVMFTLIGLDQYAKVKKRFAKNPGKVKPKYDERKTASSFRGYDKPHPHSNDSSHVHILRIQCSNYQVLRDWLRKRTNVRVHNTRCCGCNSVLDWEGKFEEIEPSME